MKKQQKKKQTAGIRKILKLKPTCFSAMALLILLVLAFQVWHRDENPLLKRNNSITLYREVYPLTVSVIGIGSSAAVLPGAIAAFIDVVGTVAFGAVEGEWLRGICSRS